SCNFVLMKSRVSASVTPAVAAKMCACESIKPGKAVLPWPSITTRPVAGAAEISVILPPLTTMEAFSICSWPVKTRTFEITKSFWAYAVTESQERARAAIIVRYTLYLLEDLAPQLTVSINCVILVPPGLENKKSEAAQILL